MTYQDLRDHDGHLLARLDPERWLLEIQRRGEKTLFDLHELLGAGEGWHIVHPAASIQDVGLNPTMLADNCLSRNYLAEDLERNTKQIVHPVPSRSEAGVNISGLWLAKESIAGTPGQYSGLPEIDPTAKVFTVTPEQMAALLKARDEQLAPESAKENDDERQGRSQHLCSH